MDLRQMRYFLVLAEEAHFGRAAERLHIVQPALSMQIRSLEEELGGALFVRTSRKVELTEAGALLRTEAQRVLDQADHAREAVGRMLRGETGRVRIGFAGNAALSGKLSHDVRGFNAAYPDAELIIGECAPRAQMEAVLAGELDVGYLPDNAIVAVPALHAESVGDWRFVAAVGASHPLAGAPAITAGMIATHALVLYASGPSDDGLLAALRPMLDREPRIAYRAASTLGVLALVTAGLGIALVPEPTTALALPHLLYKPLLNLPISTSLMMISRRHENSGAVNAYLALARAWT